MKWNAGGEIYVRGNCGMDNMIYVQAFKQAFGDNAPNRIWKKHMCYVVMWYPPTSTIVILAALHMGWLKFRAVFLIKKAHAQH